MFKSFHRCYTYICKLFSNRFDELYAINKQRLEQENLHYCIMHDGDFMKKENQQPITKETRILSFLNQT